MVYRLNFMNNSTFLIVLGGFNWWSASYMNFSFQAAHLSSTKIDAMKKVYSVVQVFGGIIGVLMPIKISAYLKKRDFIDADCLVLAGSSLTTATLFLIYFATDNISPYFAIVVYTLLIVSINLYWVPMVMLQKML